MSVVESPGFEDVLEFWFGDGTAARTEKWFMPDAHFDDEIRSRFEGRVVAAAGGDLNAWRDDAPSCLALVILLDQFPRNLYRGSADAFAHDPQALEIALAAVALGFDTALPPVRASFLYLPLEHAEDLELQDRCVELFDRLAGSALAADRARIDQFAAFARSHRQVIRQFGRFPHRNAVLGRVPTPEETAYLESGGETFGAPTRG